jgi:hypothetical protein
MRIADDDMIEPTADLPDWAAPSWHAMLRDGPAAVRDRVATLFERAGQQPWCLDVIRATDGAAFTRARSKKLRNRRHLWALHLLRSEEIVLSWVPRTEPAVRTHPLVPLGYVELLDELGRLSFATTATELLDVSQMLEEQALIGREVMPFYPHGNGDFDVFNPEHRVSTYNHEDDVLSPTAESFPEWLDRRLREHWQT